MKKIFYISILVACFCTVSNGQYRNENWLVGFNPVLVHFENGVVNNNIIPNASFYCDDAHSNIGDNNEESFYCNGFNIFSSDAQLMENGSDILPFKFINSSQGGSYSRVNQQTLILPKKDMQYYVFSFGVSDKNYDIAQINGGWYIYDILTYSVVDLSYNNGKGKVISKLNYLIENDSLSICQMSAVKHANGRDWWLVKPHFKKHLFHTFLVTANGIIEQPIQEFTTPTFTNGVNGQTNFSVDGSLFVMTSTFDSEYTQVNYFDRCTGKMTKFKSIPRPFEPAYNEGAKISGACFSPNNQFLYLINNNFIYQYDLMNEEVIELHTDSMFNSAEYTLAYNGTDGKIWLGYFNKIADKASYISNPNIKGKGAGLCQACYQVKNNNFSSPPNLPNYELGALLGSPCDTIKPPVAPELSWQPVLPNAFTPNGDGLNDHWHLLNTADMQTKGYGFKEVSVFNRWGNNVFKSNDVNFVWSGKGWASGSYFYYVRFVTSKGDIKLSKGNVQVIR